jgi:hypothetical protein
MILRTVTDGRQRYDLSAQLDGQSFRFEFSWNARGGFWSFLLSAADGTPLLRRRVVVGTPLTARFADPRLPPGELVALDTSGRSEDPGLTELGGRVQLLYLEAGDIAG